MTEPRDNSTRAVLVHIDFQTTEFNEDKGEFIELVASAGLEAVATISCKKTVPNPRYFIGEGKLEEIKQAAELHTADIIIFNHSISPGQERNLEQALNCRVIDRVELILDIFAQRARSYEGKLQVELAQLQHLSTRLIRGWTHLERQKGGIGLRGPGETQLETDRRLIGKRIKTIHYRLEKVRSQRQQGAKKRQNSDIPLISMMGYTNVGKSTLFNCLTGASVYSADKLFATLDPTLRRFEVAPEMPVIVSDTVGFIRHIPHDLVEAFHATLEEVRQSDVLLHVIDASDSERYAHADQVNEVIHQIGAKDIPQIEVFNKIDIEGQDARIEYGENGLPRRIWLSARTGHGIELLCTGIREFLLARAQRHSLYLPATAGKLRAHLFDLGAVCHEETDEQGGWLMEVTMETPRLSALCRESGLEDIGLQ